jgi:hypothetical protein
MKPYAAYHDEAIPYVVLHLVRNDGERVDKELVRMVAAVTPWTLVTDTRPVRLPPGEHLTGELGPNPVYLSDVPGYCDVLLTDEMRSPKPSRSLTFFARFWDAQPQNVRTICHEFGHTFGLSHVGLDNQTPLPQGNIMRTDQYQGFDWTVAQIHHMHAVASDWGRFLRPERQPWRWLKVDDWELEQVHPGVIT